MKVLIEKEWGKLHKCPVCSSKRLRDIQDEVAEIDNRQGDWVTIVSNAASKLGLEVSEGECKAIAYHIVSGK